MAKAEAPRVGITLDKTQKARLIALAEFDNLTPTKLATKVLLAYMDTRANDIEKVLQAQAEYERAVDKLRKQKSTEDD